MQKLMSVTPGVLLAIGAAPALAGKRDRVALRPAADAEKVPVTLTKAR